MKTEEIIEVLKPCPFCGGKAILKNKHYKPGLDRIKFAGKFEWHGEIDKWTTIWFVGCDNNECDMKPITRYQCNKEDAIKIWNKRIATELSGGEEGSAEKMLKKYAKEHPRKYESFVALIENESAIDVYDIVLKFASQFQQEDKVSDEWTDADTDHAITGN